MAYNLIVADSSSAIKKLCQSVFPEATYNLHFVANLEELNLLLDNLIPEAIILSSTILESLESLLQFNSKLSTLGRIPVFLIGGTFEPLPQEYLQSIKPEKIFLKPFYSESLAEAVKEAIEKRRVPDTLPEELPDSLPAENSSGSTTISPSLLREVRLLIQQEVLETERELEKRLRSNLLHELKTMMIREKAGAQENRLDDNRRKG
ncbi:MAG: hypothetical protein H5U06_09865 [Candidatus Aminicenantes bacterium]|nr:hypothetical protein [Candidatus Aminicenantes bacterium]